MIYGKTILLVGSLLAGVLGDDGEMPACGTSCIYTSTEADVACAASDLACLCASAVFIDTVASCLAATCVGAGDIDTTVTNAAGLCEAVTGEDMLDRLEAAVAVYTVPEASERVSATVSLAAASTATAQILALYDATTTNPTANASVTTAPAANYSLPAYSSNATSSSSLGVSTSGGKSAARIGVSTLLGATSGAVALLLSC